MILHVISKLTIAHKIGSPSIGVTVCSPEEKLRVRLSGNRLTTLSIKSETQMNGGSGHEVLGQKVTSTRYFLTEEYKHWRTIIYMS